MKLEEIPIDKGCMILCGSEQRREVEMILDRNGIEPFYLDYRDEPESAIVMNPGREDYTDVIDYKSKAYSNYTTISAATFIANNS